MTKSDLERRVHWAYGSRGVRIRHSWKAWIKTPRAHIFKCKHASRESEPEVGWGHQCLKPTPSDRLPPAMLYLLNLPRQPYQPDTKCPNTRTCRGQFSFKPPKKLEGLSQGPFFEQIPCRRLWLWLRACSRTESHSRWEGLFPHFKVYSPAKLHLRRS